eukprot:TRINITY_DN2063_c0_g2_i1.p1 TRINITY_DN2063_c0_g2~~TRINITY_DN2063_c0_g2_i1.p1  ORF type:complete len:366 (+),score=88.54 TRINITY_DN2063_c0_g2_i1:83-1180(+)
MSGLKVVITGASGFIGVALATQLAHTREIRNAQGQLTPIAQIVLFDCHFTDDLDPLIQSKPDLFQVVKGDLTDRNLIQKIMSLQSDSGQAFSGVSVFHLASILSGQGEEDFDLCIAVNLDGSRNILEALRSLNLPNSPIVTKLIFTSTAAVYGPVDVITDDSPLDPSTTYGNTKICAEKLLADYHRKKFLVGAGVRLPTVLLRPTPNRAASNCFNAVMREPLLGRNYSLPVPFTFSHPFTSRKNVINSLIHLHEIIRESFSPEEPSDVDKVLGISRMLVIAARSYTLQELYDSALKYAKETRKMPDETIGKVEEGVDEQIASIVRKWPSRIEYGKAKKLQFPDNIHVTDILDEFVAYHEHHSQKQ